MTKTAIFEVAAVGNVSYVAAVVCELCAGIFSGAAVGNVSYVAVLSEITAGTVGVALQLLVMFPTLPLNCASCAQAYSAVQLLEMSPTVLP